MTTEEATQVMGEANRIIEDFPVGKYAVYLFAFAAEIAFCIWYAI